MDIRYRIERFTTLATRHAAWHWASVGRVRAGGVGHILTAALLAVAASSIYGEGAAEQTPMEQPDGNMKEPVPIIVNLAADADPEAIADVRERVMERLREEMTAEEFDAIRTYANFPLISLSADGDLIVLLLSLPEVTSIEPDHEFTLADDAPSTF